MNKPFAVTSRSEICPPEHAGRLQRTQGSARISFSVRGGATRLDRLFQSGAAKIRLPNPPSGEPPQAVLINSAGGLTGGDRIANRIELGPGSRAMVTSQACEKIYRSPGGHAGVTASLAVGGGARLDWIPQETILFDGAHLVRALHAELAENATLLILEAVICGRAAHGESVNSGALRDRWRIRRGERLIFADDLHLDWATAGVSSKPAVLDGGTAWATMLLVSAEAERRLEPMRRILGADGGVSAWDGKLLARLVARDGAALRRVLIPALAELLDGAAIPRIWLM